MFEIFFLGSLLAISFSQLLPEKEQPSRVAAKESVRAQSPTRGKTHARQDQAKMAGTGPDYHSPRGGLCKRLPMTRRAGRQRIQSL
jgi:hypothetical protein